MSNCITFKTVLKIIGINPFVFIPEEILEDIFLQSGKRKGYIPLKVSVNGSELFPQTLLRYDGDWRPSLRKEIVRYIGNLKSEESIQRNVIKAINFLLGNGSFVGRNLIPKKLD